MSISISTNWNKYKLMREDFVMFTGGFISSGWKARYFVLYEDSSLLWYESHESFHHRGGVRLKVFIL